MDCELDELQGYGGGDLFAVLVEGHASLRDAHALSKGRLRQAKPVANGLDRVHAVDTSAASSTSQQRRYLPASLAPPIIAAMAAKAPKNGKVTSENREESRLLLQLWLRAKPRLKAAGYGSQEAFGAKFNIGNQAAVGFFLNGKSALSAKAAAGFARGLGVLVEEFSPRLAAILSTKAEQEPSTATFPAAVLAPHVAFYSALLAMVDEFDTGKRSALLEAAKRIYEGGSNVFLLPERSDPRRNISTPVTPQQPGEESSRE